MFFERDVIAQRRVESGLRPALRDSLGQPWIGVVITSVSFGMGHTLQGLDAAVITGALGAAWGIKEQLRTLLACGSLADAHEEKMRLGY